MYSMAEADVVGKLVQFAVHGKRLLTRGGIILGKFHPVAGRHNWILKSSRSVKEEL